MARPSVLVHCVPLFLQLLSVVKVDEILSALTPFTPGRVIVGGIVRFWAVTPGVTENCAIGAHKFRLATWLYLMHF